jgi:prophage antirepressor-like protein
MSDRSISTNILAVTPAAPVPFGFDGKPVRVVVRDGEPWFVGADVCAALGIKDAHRAISRLDDDERGVTISPTLGGEQGVGVISEAGMYTLVLRSHGALTPNTVAYRFRKWVTGEVLPAIRKTGEYQTTKLRDELAAAQARILLLEAPRQPDLCVDDAARVLGVDTLDLFLLLVDRQWMYRRSNGAGLLARTEAIDAGFMVQQAVELKRFGVAGRGRWVLQGCVTPLGMQEIRCLLRKRAEEQARDEAEQVAWMRDICA